MLGAFLSRILAVARVETLRLLLDRSSMGLILIVPAVQLILFGYAVNLTPKNVTLAVSRSCGAQRDTILGAAAATRAFAVVPMDTNLPPSDYIEDRQALVAIGCQGGLLSVAADASAPSAVRPAVGALHVELLSRLTRDLIPESAADIKVRWLYNPEGRTSWWLAPGLVGVVIMISMLMLGALTLVREREQGSWEGLLAAPVTAFEVLVGKLAPYVVLAMLQAIVVIGVARWLLNVPVLGSAGVIVLAAALFAIAHLTLGFALSAIAQNQIQAVQAAVFFYLPSMLLSGFMFPFEGMPRWARLLGESLPLTHFLRVTRALFLKGGRGADLSAEMWPIALFALAASVFAIGAYRRKMFRLVPILIFLGLTACAATPGHVHQSKQVDEVNNQQGLALQGYDPVAYFKDGEPKAGDATITSTWHGATYRFASTGNQQAFLADPDKYAPQFGGYCAYAVSRGTTANGDPHQWAIVNDRLFLNNNALAATLWNRDRPGNIEAGGKNWPLIPKRPLTGNEPATQVGSGAGAAPQK
jgi:ABC-2 type transport system permease protein